MRGASARLPPVLLGVAAGLTWRGLVGWAAQVPETRQREEIRTAASVALVGFGLLAPAAGRREAGRPDEEETL